MNNNYTIAIYGIQDVNHTAIPTLSHDHSIAVMQNGGITFFGQLERLNRKKHSNAMPAMVLDLLKEKKLINNRAEIIFIDNILGRSFINKQGNIRFEGPLAKKLRNSYETGKLWWFDQTKPAFVLNHELAHIGSCLPFYGSFRDNSLWVHYDGGASLSNFSAWHFKNKKIIPLEAHWNLKKYASLFNANALTFGIIQAKMADLNSVPGKFMGFAALGKYNHALEDWLERNNYFENIWKSKTLFYTSLKKHIGIELSYLDQKNKWIQDIAATMHHVFVRESYNQIKELQQTTKSEYLYYSGGAALNIALNSQLVNSGLFSNIFIPPCCNDSGLALGAAAFFQWKNGQAISIHSPYQNNWGIENYKTTYSKETIAETSKLLLQQKVIGVCNGQAEIGPRALGNRSIIAIASSSKLAEKVSRIHKKREWYRPVAPIMLEKNTLYFTKKESIHHLSKYMLIDFSIEPSKRQEIIGVVHANGSARIQTLFSRSENPFMFDLLTYLDEKHQIKALINTSFNYRGEPITHTLEDAKKSAQFMKLDALILNGKLERLID